MDGGTPMIRIQVRLRKEQVEALRAMAQAEGVSVAELIRRGADMVIARGASATRAARVRRARSVVGN